VYTQQWYMSYRFMKLVHPVGFIIKTFFTMHGLMNVKKLLIFVHLYFSGAHFSFWYYILLFGLPKVMLFVAAIRGRRQT
jgi:hypothetical protein